MVLELNDVLRKATVGLENIYTSVSSNEEGYPDRGSCGIRAGGLLRLCGPADSGVVFLGRGGRHEGILHVERRHPCGKHLDQARERDRDEPSGRLRDLGTARPR